MILHCGGAQHDSLNTHIEEGIHNGHAPDSAPNLYFHAGSRSCQIAQHVEIFRFAFKCSIEIDDMQPLRALAGPLFRHFPRIAVNGGIAFPALLEPDGLTSKNVDGRVNLHIAKPAQN